MLQEIYTPPEGTDDLRPHGVVVVGYGTTNEEPFWTTQNCYTRTTFFSSVKRHLRT